MTDDHDPKPNSEASRQVLAVDWTTRDSIVVTGTERQSWLNAIVTCDVGRLRVGEGVWGLLLTRQGKIVTEMTVVASDQQLLLSVPEQHGVAVVGSLDRMLIMEDAELEPASSRYAWFALHGPAAPLEARRAAQLLGATAAEVNWTGIGGAALVVDRAQVDGARGYFAESQTVRIASAAEWLELRLECGLPELGTDFGTDDNPHQAGLERRAVAWDKGCYLGQEVVCMVDMRGKVRRRLASLVLTAECSPPPGTGVFVADREESIGVVTSSAVSCRLRQGIALARLLTTHSEPGTRVMVAGVPGVVSALPDELPGLC